MQHGVADVTEAVLGASRALVGIAARSLVCMGQSVTLAQYRVLVLLHGRGPQAMGDLAATLGVNPSRVRRLYNVLVDKRLIRRKPAPENPGASAPISLGGDGISWTRSWIGDVRGGFPQGGRARGTGAHAF
ncbi:MAG TPA: MarR family transcriptional regulator [Acidimicrobiales bacterium]|nr:MarR family transcriptional regulator [Acidimicrobiales bacterium]